MSIGMSFVSPATTRPAIRQSWRIVGRWGDGSEFLVTLGESRDECLARMPAATSDLTSDDLRAVDTFWLEEWDPGTELRAAEWVPVEEIDLRKLRLRVASLEQHAR